MRQIKRAITMRYPGTAMTGNDAAPCSPSKQWQLTSARRSKGWTGMLFSLPLQPPEPLQRRISRCLWRGWRSTRHRRLLRGPSLQNADAGMPRNAVGITCRRSASFRCRDTFWTDPCRSVCPISRMLDLLPLGPAGFSPGCRRRPSSGECTACV